MNPFATKHFLKQFLFPQFLFIHNFSLQKLTALQKSSKQTHCKTEMASSDQWTEHPHFFLGNGETSRSAAVPERWARLLGNVPYCTALEKRGKVSLSICVGLAPRRWGCGGGVKPSRVGKDGPTHPPLKQNGHHCDNLISDVRHRHVKFKHLLELKTVQTVCQNNLNTSTSVEQLTQHRFAKQFWVCTNNFSLNPSINPKAAWQARTRGSAGQGSREETRTSTLLTQRNKEVSQVKPNLLAANLLLVRLL